MRSDSLKGPMGLALAALFLAAPLEAGSKATTVQINLDCTATPAPYCSALQDGLQDHAPHACITIFKDGDIPTTSGLTIALEITRQAESFVIGRLTWAHSGAQTSTGPEVEVSSSDANLTARTPADLVSGLLRVTDLPI